MSTPARSLPNAATACRARSCASTGRGRAPAHGAQSDIRTPRTWLSMTLDGADDAPGRDDHTEIAAQVVAAASPSCCTGTSLCKMSRSERERDLGTTRMDAVSTPDRIRPANPDEGERLRAIAIAAKSYWGYDLDRVREWAAMGDFSPGGLRRKQIYVADVAGEAVGWAAAIDRGEVFWLEDLWIDPERMGQGVGRRLFQHTAARGRQSGAVRMEWEAERHALGFYEKMGGRYLRDS